MVVVQDTTLPTLTLLGTNPLGIAIGTPFVDPGASASDICAGDLTSAIGVTGSVNTNQAGSYMLTYTVADPSGNTGTTNRTVVVLAKTPATVTLSNLSQTYDGTAKSVTATTTPPGLAVDLTYYGSAAAPTNVGSYTVVGIINDPNYQGGATNTLIIAPAAPIITDSARSADGVFRLTFIGYSNINYCVWVSTDLHAWQYLGPAVQTTPGVFSFLDKSATNLPLRFYRISTACGTGTWTSHETNRNWWAVASSADGTKLVATVYAGGGQIYTSTDSGGTWTARESNRQWDAVASSADGTKLVAAERAGSIYTSTNSGVTWTPRGSYGTWVGLASSADGTKLVAVSWNYGIWTSTDSGLTWIRRNTEQYFYSVASSSDGNKLVVSQDNGRFRILTSADGGTNWTPRIGSMNWSSVASSADGTKLAATDSAGRIYISTDSGTTWTARENDRPWSGIASSADGTRLGAVVSGGQIYLSNDSGLTWTASCTTPLPSRSLVAASG
jgi:hypothetical protein